MNQSKYVFARLFEFVSHNDFLKFVKIYQVDYNITKNLNFILC